MGVRVVNWEKEEYSPLESYYSVYVETRDVNYFSHRRRRKRDSANSFEVWFRSDGAADCLKYIFREYVSTVDDTKLILKCCGTGNE